MTTRLTYAENSPILKEMSKPAIKYIPCQNHGLVKLKNRIKKKKTLKRL